MKKIRKCSCELCTRHKNADKIIKRKNVNELIKLVNELLEKLLNAEEDVDYYKAILNGDWVNSKEILSNTLIKLIRKDI